MNVETLLTILLASVLVTFVVRLFAGWTLSGWLITFLLAVLGAVAGWQIERWLGLSPLFSFPFPGDEAPVSVAGPAIGALALAAVGALLARPGHRAAPQRTRRSR